MTGCGAVTIYEERTMAEIIRHAKPLTVSPLKASQPIGAALAFLGLRNCLPMLHGAQGCTAFGKVFLVRHFREPIPLQTTAMDQIATVMNSDENVIVGLKTSGTFMPVLIAIAFLQTNLVVGLLGFLSIVGVGLVIRSWLSRLRSEEHTSELQSQR